MKSKLTIGVDIGGTHTDAVIINQQQEIISAKKVLTTTPLKNGFRDVLIQVLDNAPFPLNDIQAISVGTTHATNALLERKDLFKVGIIRLNGQKNSSLPPCYGWSDELKSCIVAETVLLNGGFECDGREITPLNKEEIIKGIDFLIDSGAQSIAITGVCSPLNPSQEKFTAQVIQEHLKNAIPLSLSHEIGGIGIIERENATILNATLKQVMSKGLRELETIKNEMGLTCPLYVTQNNGSLIALQQAIDLPILTLFAGQTNSFVGGAKLAGLSNAILVDIGGTSTDVGVIKNGIPRQSLNNCTIEDIPLNFSNPDVISIALGGGSHVNEMTVGPQSCAKNLLAFSQAFGGSRLTLTDVALKLGILTIEEAKTSRIVMTEEKAKAVMKNVGMQLENLINKTHLNSAEFPIVIVGGGAQLISKDYFGLTFMSPSHGNVANAYGAALAGISAKVDQIVSLVDREQTLNLLKKNAIEEAISKGACHHHVQVKDIQIIPYHYMQGNKARVIITAGGPRS